MIAAPFITDIAISGGISTSLNGVDYYIFNAGSNSTSTITITFNKNG